MNEQQTNAEQLQNPLKPRLCKMYKLFFVTFSVCLTSMVWGIGVCYTSPALPNINEHPNPFHLTDSRQSLVSSVFAIGGMFGGLSAGYFLDKLGRKQTFIFSVLPHVIGWLMIVSSTNSIIFGFGRFIIGIFYGMSIVSVSTYLAEITPSKARGRFVAAQAVFSSLGMLFVSGFGLFLPWNWLALCPIVILTIHMMTLPFIPESPRWLMKNGYNDDAKETLEWLRPEEDITDELECIKQQLLNNNTISFKDFRNKRHYKPVLITCGLMATQVLSGIDYLYFYSVLIFENSRAIVNVSPYAQATIVFSFGFIGVFFAIGLVDRYGRRFLLMSSGLIMAFCMAVLGTYYDLVQYNSDLTARYLQWLPIVSLLIYQSAYTLGLGPVPCVVMSEIIRTNARGKASGLCCIVLNVLTFVVTEWGRTLSEGGFHQCGVFWLFALFCFLGTLFVFIVLPETKGKSLEEMDKLFS